jgi:uncharacterized protein
LRRALVERRAAGLLRASKEIVLDCGDGVRLQGFHASLAEKSSDSSISASRRLAVLLHGWEGSADSLYVLSLDQGLFEQGYEVVRLNLRDHGATHHLNRELFHSCRLPEVIGALRRLQTSIPGKTLSLIGFSLGGNFMLRAAAQAAESGLDIDRVIAVSPVLDPAETMTALEKGWTAYHSYFVRKWASSLLKKQAAWPRDYDFADLVSGVGLRHMTAELVRRHTEYPSLEDYLNGYAITGEALAKLEVPAHIITAQDDPIIPVHGLARIAHPRALSITTVEHGGHCGFWDAVTGQSWVERRILAEL